MSRESFRTICMERDGGTCVVPTCDEPVQDVHHIMERRLWGDGGYVPDNGASVCGTHHLLAENNVIPPQAFWRWIGVEDPPLPNGIDYHSNKWGDPFEKPPWLQHRDNIKYPSTRHLPWSHERDTDDTAHGEIEWATGYPLVVTVKMDGGNAMIIKDTDNPVRARNGRHANADHFDMLKRMYWENDLYTKIPKHLQVFGEWLYAKHSIHYGCDCDESCEDVGPALDDYFQVFGVYDNRYSLWLSWHETEEVAEHLGLPTVPLVATLEDEKTYRLWDRLYNYSKMVTDDGHEGIVVRSALPYHYGQIGQRLGKYVRPGHVKEDEEHWSHRTTVVNRKY